MQTIREIGSDAELDAAIADAFPGAGVEIATTDGYFELEMQQHGLLRPLKAAELSDGTLRYLLLIAALLSPRPPSLMILNEPETSLHPDLLPPLARLIAQAAQRSQIVVVSHAVGLVSALAAATQARQIVLEKQLGETVVARRRAAGLDLADAVSAPGHTVLALKTTIDRRATGPPSATEEICMTSIDKFEDHCWKDVIPQADIELYAGWRRETFVGPRPALLAIDLYDLVYRGGPHSPYELNERFANTCGIYAHAGDRADQAAVRGRPRGRHSGVLLHPGHEAQQPAAGRGLDPAPAPHAGRRALRHLSRVHPAGRRHRHLQAARQRLCGHPDVLASGAARHPEPDRMRRKHVRMRARERGRCLFQRLSRHHRGAMHL